MGTSQSNASAAAAEATITPSTLNFLLNKAKEKLGIEETDNPDTLVEFGKGSSNYFYRYSFDGLIDQDIAVRISQDSVTEFTEVAKFWSWLPKQWGSPFWLENKNVEVSNVNQSLEDIQSKENWEQSSLYQLSPELYYYQFIEDPFGRGGGVHLCVISEAYDMDLYKFYMNQNYPYQQFSNEEKLDKDEEVFRQLSELLTSMVTDFELICFDIKPANSVIKLQSDGTIKVKLIDWDGDWCIPVNTMISREAVKLYGERLPDYLSILLHMNMALHFKFMENNVFENVFGNYLIHLKERLDQESVLESDLEFLFSYLEDFGFVTQHYFNRQLPESLRLLSGEDGGYKKIFQFVLDELGLSGSKRELGKGVRLKGKKSKKKKKSKKRKGRTIRKKNRRFKKKKGFSLKR